MDLGTILLIVAAVVGGIDIGVMFIGPRIGDYDAISFGMTVVATFAAFGSAIWMLLLIFNNQFQYDYVFQTTSTTSDWFLKLSALWAGQSGSLVFWTMLSFLLYLFYRFSIRGYEDDIVVYRASIIMAFQAVIITINTILAQPFRVTEGIVRSEGLGLNPLLRTFWNVIHPPIVFIGYAMIMVPFAIKLAGFTIRSEERNAEKIPVLDTLSNYVITLAWVMLSLGIVIGGYWAYIVLGWGGYWGWDPVETTSLVPWLLLTCYFHSKPILSKHDVMRDSFIVFAFPSVIFATWVTRSGVLSSVHGFSISIVSWSMLATLLLVFILSVIITLWSGYRDIETEEEDEEKSFFHWFFDFSNLRHFSLKIALVGLIIILEVSVIGVSLPAAINLKTILTNPEASLDELVSIGPDFFWLGFYIASFFLVVSAFYCMETALLRSKTKGIVVIFLLIIGGILGLLTIQNPSQPLPTTNWVANALVPSTVGALIYLVVIFVRTIAGREKAPFTARKMGRVMLHLGLIMLILGVVMSENAIYESNAAYRINDAHEIAPQIWVKVEDIDLVYWNHERDFKMVVTVLVIEGNMVVGVGMTSVQGYPEWGSVAHSVYIQNSPARDVFIAVTGFTQIAPNELAVTLHVKVLPIVSFVWTGSFFMIAAMLPMIGIEQTKFTRALKEKFQDTVEDASDNIDDSSAAE